MMTQQVHADGCSISLPVELFPILGSSYLSTSDSQRKPECYTCDKEVQRCPDHVQASRGLSVSFD